jgi:hypothetical protein
MSLDNIQIPSSVIQTLFKDSLIDLNTEQSKPVTNKKQELAFLGQNKKGILLLVNSPSTTYLPDELLNFLLGILTACKLSMADVALMNIAKQSNTDYLHLTEKFQAEKIFLFGLPTNSIGLPLDFPTYQVQSYNQQVYLRTATLEELENNKEEKTKLWNCLKKIFLS